MEGKSYPVVEKYFIEWKLYEDLRHNMVPCVVQRGVCWGKSLSLLGFLVVEAETERERERERERESYDFFASFTMLLWSRHLVTNKYPILESKDCNSYGCHLIPMVERNDRNVAQLT